MRLLSGDDVRALTPRDAVSAMRDMLIAYARGTYFSPARVSTMVAGARVLFSAGGSSDGAMGIRVSGPAASSLEHLTISWLATGEIDAVIVGNEIGARRTGAVSAVATDALAAPGAVKVGMIGSGRNGWAQIWALTGARSVERLAVYSPTLEHRVSFAARVHDELDLDARAVDSAREAVEGMDVVILCTTSRTPVVESGWIKDGAHVTSIGAKTTTAHEVPEELLERVRRVVSDAPEEIVSPVSELAHLPLIGLSAVLIDGDRSRLAEEVSLFLYAGLGGGDAYYAQAVARRALHGR